MIDGTYEGQDVPSDISVLRQMTNGLCYIHQNQLVHGDIKPDNVIISTSGQIQISSDFGICKLVLPKDTIIMDEYENTALCMAPEILIPYNDPSFDDDVQLEFTSKSDIFSAGCVFFVFATRRKGGVHPYGNRRNHLEVLCNIKAKHPVNIEGEFLTHYFKETMETYFLYAKQHVQFFVFIYRVIGNFDLHKTLSC